MIYVLRVEGVHALDDQGAVGWAKRRGLLQT